MKAILLGILSVIAFVCTSAQAENLRIGSVLELKAPLTLEKENSNGVIYADGEVRKSNMWTYWMTQWCAIDFTRPATGFALEAAKFYQYAPGEMTVTGIELLQRNQSPIYKLSNGLRLTCTDSYADIATAFGKLIVLKSY